MALINKIREKTGLAVGIIAFGLILFLLGGDLLSPNSALMGGGQDRTVGEIAGKEISYEEFQSELDVQIAAFRSRMQRQPSEAEMASLREQTWTRMINRYGFGGEYRDLGIQVTEDEQIDMVQGENIHPYVKMQLGVESAEEVKQLLASLPPEYQQQWTMMEQEIVAARLREKYENLFLKTNYVPSAMGKEEYAKQTATAEAKYLYVPFYAVADSSMSVSEQEMRHYIEEHPSDFEVEESRSIEFVTFSLQPTAQDSALATEELSQIASEWANAADDSLYAMGRTDSGNPVEVFNQGNLPANLADEAPLEDGQVYGPYLNAGNFVLYKVLDQYEDTVSAARASHILIRTQGDETADAAAREEAQTLLRRALDGENFANLARQNSDDGSASNGGDLGWFTEGQMVPAFNDAVFNASEEGVIGELIETNYGYHIIKVNNLKSNAAYKVGVINREILPSAETQDDAYMRASRFAASVENYDQFVQAAEEEGLRVMKAPRVGKNDRRLGAIDNARNVIRWAFRDASVGDVSAEFEVGDNYVVAAVKGKTEKGLAPLADVEIQVKKKVQDQKAAQQIIENLESLNTEDLDAMAQEYSDAKVYSNSNIKLNSSSLPSVGFAPVAIGKIFGLNEGEVSEPFQGETGVLVVKLEAKTEAGEIADYTNYINEIAQQRGGRISFDIANAVKELSDVEDERYRFY
ncbi:peptidylprolyl isomerase [Roseivirga sp. BDSF3-8]|uniref:peptidylprolyl isomerase n=1 Tax=Roseivirga sp. BDSF3-8 TaxID=3241598 RepID=UPI003531D2DD